jgi:Arc/MetJ family transcription regulator
MARTRKLAGLMATRLVCTGVAIPSNRVLEADNVTELNAKVRAMLHR